MDWCHYRRWCSEASEVVRITKFLSHPLYGSYPGRTELESWVEASFKMFCMEDTQTNTGMDLTLVQSPIITTSYQIMCTLIKLKGHTICWPL